MAVTRESSEAAPLGKTAEAASGEETRVLGRNRERHRALALTAWRHPDELAFRIAQIEAPLQLFLEAAGAGPLISLDRRNRRHSSLFCFATAVQKDPD
jgi:hypothetical protein